MWLSCCFDKRFFFPAANDQDCFVRQINNLLIARRCSDVWSLSHAGAANQLGNNKNSFRELCSKDCGYCDTMNIMAVEM